MLRFIRNRLNTEIATARVAEQTGGFATCVHPAKYSPINSYEARPLGLNQYQGGMCIWEVLKTT